MVSHIERSIDIADKLTTKAEGALAALEQEMILMKWPGDFRAIMWETVAAIASQRAAEAKPTAVR